MSSIVACSRRIDPWLYPKAAAALAVVACMALGAPRMEMALALHGLMDFTLQPAWMCAAKARGDQKTLALHAIMAGGLPGWFVGGLIGAVVGMATHWAIDSRNKFGLRGIAGLALDQALHVAVIIVIVISVGVLP
jgi:hypothetical protein